MDEIEKALFDSIRESSKKADYFLFATIVVCMMNLFSLVNQDYQFISEFPKIVLNNPVSFFLMSTIIIMSLFGITGLHIINYLVKRFSYELILFTQDPLDKKKKRFPITQNIYEFVFVLILGRELIESKINDASRKMSFVFLIILLGTINALAFINSIFFVCSIWTTKFGYPGLGLPFAVLLISFFLWKSFFYTINKRRKEARRLAKNL